MTEPAEEPIDAFTGSDEPAPTIVPIPLTRRQTNLARWVLFSFVLTFVASRTMVILIMMRKVPDFFLHIGHGDTHVHHLNYGIFLLSFVGGYLVMFRPGRRMMVTSAIFYGIGLALTFDEFGMWLHLGGSYWQRGSFDAVVTITGLLLLIVLAPTYKKVRAQHWIAGLILAAAAIGFAIMLTKSMNRFYNKRMPFFERIEENGPS